MTFSKMAVNTFLLLLILPAFTTCNHEIKTAESITQFKLNVGYTVSAIGKNIRYIFQDTQNNIWFASDDEGVFRYTGRYR